jgi:hypothetical protein
VEPPRFLMHSATRRDMLEIRLPISAWGISSQPSWIRRPSSTRVLGGRYHVPDLFYRR